MATIVRKVWTFRQIDVPPDCYLSRAVTFQGGTSLWIATLTGSFVGTRKRGANIAGPFATRKARQHSLIGPANAFRNFIGQHVLRLQARMRHRFLNSLNFSRNAADNLNRWCTGALVLLCSAEWSRLASIDGAPYPSGQTTIPPIRPVGWHRAADRRMHALPTACSHRSGERA